MIDIDQNLLEIQNKNISPYSYNYIYDKDEEAEELIANSYMCLNFPSIELLNTNKYLQIIRQIEKFTLLNENWDGFNSVPLSKAVAEKSKVIIENIDFDFYENYDFEVKLTPYSTLLIDWFKNENEFSLEIGKDYLGYYYDGEISKEVDKLEISTVEQITKAISQVEEDLKKIL